MWNRFKMRAIAREEIVHHLRQPAYYFSLVITLVLFVAAAALPRLQVATANLSSSALFEDTAFSDRSQ